MTLFFEERFYIRIISNSINPSVPLFWNWVYLLWINVFLEKPGHHTFIWLRGLFIWFHVFINKCYIISWWLDYHFICHCMHLKFVTVKRISCLNLSKKNLATEICRCLLMSFFVCLFNQYTQLQEYIFLGVCVQDLTDLDRWSRLSLCKWGLKDL